MTAACAASPAVPPLQPTVDSILNAKNHFQVLGLPPRYCGGQELKRAYKMTALRVHPDRCPDEGATEAFTRLQEAFAVLNDPALHARYTQKMAQAKNMAEARSAAGKARERNAAYAARAKMTKEDLERQVKEMLARQNKSRPMAQSAAAQKAAEERVSKERLRQERLAAEEREKQRAAARRREESEKALNSARNKTPRRQKPAPAWVETEADPSVKAAAEERARRRAASMAMLGSAMRWEVDKEGNLLDKDGNPVRRASDTPFGSPGDSRSGTDRSGGGERSRFAAAGGGAAAAADGEGEGGQQASDDSAPAGAESETAATPRSARKTPRDGAATPRSSRRDGSSKSPRRSSSGSNSARSSPHGSPFGDLKTMRRAQTERSGLRRPSSARGPPDQYLPRFMQNVNKRAAAQNVVVSV